MSDCRSSVRMDTLKNTVEIYSGQLKDMTNGLEEMERRVAKLQKNLEMKKEKNESLRVQVEALRAKDMELKNQDKLGMDRIEELNSTLREAEKMLADKREMGEELRKKLVEKVTSFENNSHDIAIRFQSLQLNTEEDENTVTSEDVAMMQDEVDEIKEQIKVIRESQSDLPLTPIKDFIEEVRAMIEAQRALKQELAIKETNLKNELLALQEGKTPQPQSEERIQ